MLFKGVKAMERLSKCIAERPGELKKLKDGGAKVVGTLGLGYVPEELIYACGAVPQRLIKGGRRQPVDEAHAYCHTAFSTFHKAQIGYLLGGKEPLYNSLDYLVVEAGDWFSELAGMHVYAEKRMPTTWLGIPGNFDFSGALQYFIKSLEKLRATLEELTGKKLSDEKLKEYILLYNEMRSLLGAISHLRKSPSPPISGLDFIKLNHASFYCEPHAYVDVLRSIYNEMKGAEGVYKSDTPRIAIFGCPIAEGDYVLPQMIEDAGGAIVAEELCGGVRHFESNTVLNGSLMESLAARYYPPYPRDPWKYPWGEDLPSLYTGIVEDYNVKGVIWYQLMYMEAFAYLGHVVGKRLKKLGIPMMTLQSEYDLEGRMEANRTRVETFVEIVRTSGKGA
jgi:benzoyl-CoA reductase/2-hydroxyglutaryl-CoA dehydratase subunit BcrC/BadD/HgdB